MAFWIVAEALVSIVGVYNITRGIYNLYSDAELIKKEYRQHKRCSEEYRIAQLGHRRDPLTESQYQYQEHEFIIIE